MSLERLYREKKLYELQKKQSETSIFLYKYLNFSRLEFLKTIFPHLLSNERVDVFR